MRDRRRSNSTRHMRLLVALLIAATPVGGAAQTEQREQEKPDTATAKTGGRRLFTMKDLFIAGGFAMATVAAFPLDEAAARELQNPNTQANRFFKHASTGVELIASPGAYLIG